jgi:hypothetical protein
MAGVGAEGGAMAPPPPPQLLLPARKSITALSATELASLRKAYAQMKAWNSAPHGSADFRRSLTYWANMHAYFGAGCANANGLNAAGMTGLSAQSMSNPDETATWCKCQHGTVQFLTWHRMYLYYFEKVLQAASGDPKLRLPYWDYETDGHIPPAYRASRYLLNGLTRPNPLFVKQRQAQLNAGTAALDPAVVSTTTPMAQSTYNPFNSLIEQTPHGAVHCSVGVSNCPTGYMGAVPAAGNDPIFYSHHANIDRLYECWLKVNQAARLPNNPAQLAAQFTFVDGAGALQTRTVSDMLTTAQLHYRYTAGGGCPRVFVRAPNLELAVQRIGPFPVGDSIKLNAGTTRIPLKIAPQVRTMLKSREEGVAQQRTNLVLDGLAYDEVPPVLYKVYVQGPDGKRELVGVLNFFNATAPHMDMGEESPGHAMPNQVVLDATDALRAVAGRSDADAQLVLEPTTGLSGSTPTEAAKRISPRANVRIGSARIEVR